MIPQQLWKDEFRFVLIHPKSKLPVEAEWQKENNYRWDDPKLTTWIGRGGNYGVVCGRGGLGVFDADELDMIRDLGILEHLPNTFTVSSSPGKEHRYYIVPGMTKKIVMKHAGKHLGEFQGPGTQVVGPGSTHPTGSIYTVVRDIPIVELPDANYLAILGILGKRRWSDEMCKDSIEYGDISKLRIEDIGYPVGDIKFTGDEIQGTHPLHGSVGGKNYRIDPGKNAWRCDRCESGGGPALFLAMKYGILECDQCLPGALRGDGFTTVLKRATEEGLIVAERTVLPLTVSKVPPTVIKTDDQIPVVESVITEPIIRYNPMLRVELERTNFVNQYIEYAKTTSDAYEEYHFAAAITLLSMAADRNLVVAMQHGDIHLNTWIFCLGDSTISRKSTAHKLCLMLLKMRFPKCALPSAFSPEALTEAIAETPRGFLAKDEAGSLLAAMRKDYMAETRDFFCELYECGDYYRRTKKSGEIYITDPYIVQLLMTTPASLSEYTTAHDVMSGWLVRYLWFAPNHPKPWRAIAQKTEADIRLWDAIQVEYMKRCASIPRKRLLKVSDDGMELYSTWQQEIEEKLMLDGDNITKAIAGRLAVYAIKLAGLFTFGREDFNETTQIGEDHIREATRLIDAYFLPVGCAVISEVERAESTNTQNKIMGVLRRSGGKIGRRNLLRSVHLRLSEVADAIEALKESGELQEGYENSEKGNLVACYYLV